MSHDSTTVWTTHNILQGYHSVELYAAHLKLAHAYSCQETGLPVVSKAKLKQRPTPNPQRSNHKRGLLRPLRPLALSPLVDPKVWGFGAPGVGVPLGGVRGLSLTASVPTTPMLGAPNRVFPELGASVATVCRVCGCSGLWSVPRWGPGGCEVLVNGSVVLPVVLLPRGGRCGGGGGVCMVAGGAEIVLLLPSDVSVAITTSFTSSSVNWEGPVATRSGGDAESSSGMLPEASVVFPSP